jgi:hypothetical protein
VLLRESGELRAEPVPLEMSTEAPPESARTSHLRRTAASLPWKRLFAEFTVIVSGVLLALAADSWWERHREQGRARKYLQQLLVDFRETDSRIRGTIAGDSLTLEWVNSVVNRAFRGVLPKVDSLDLPTGYNQFRPLTGTLTALLQGGELHLLGNDSLRFELSAYAALLDATEATLRHTETLIWNSSERVILGRARHSQYADRRAARASGWGEIDVAGVLNDPEIISALQVQASASENRLRNLRRLKEPTRRIITLMQAELK